MGLANDWLNAKRKEDEAKEERRRIEDLMGSSYEEDGYTIKITERVNRKVDAQLLEELGAEMPGQLDALFRWTAELREGAWKNCHQEITAKLAPAIITTPGRASYKIEESK